MTKKLKIIMGIVCFIFIMGIVYLFYVFDKSNTEIVKDSEKYYKIVEEYLIAQEEPHYRIENKYEEINTNINDFKVFISMEKFGVEQKNDEIYVYVWALVESYYMQEGKLICNSGSSIPYKFTIIDENVEKCEQPLDGTEYAPSIKRIFTNEIARKIYDVDGSKLNKEVKKQVSEYYGDNYKKDYDVDIDIKKINDVI